MSLWLGGQSMTDVESWELCYAKSLNTLTVKTNLKRKFGVPWVMYWGETWDTRCWWTTWELLSSHLKPDWLSQSTVIRVYMFIISRCIKSYSCIREICCRLQQPAGSVHTPAQSVVHQRVESKCKLSLLVAVKRMKTQLSSSIYLQHHQLCIDQRWYNHC